MVKVDWRFFQSAQQLHIQHAGQREEEENIAELRDERGDTRCYAQSIRP